MSARLRGSRRRAAGSRGGALLAPVLLLAAACAAPRPAPEPPAPLCVASESFAGTSLSGPLPGPAPGPAPADGVDPARALAIRLELARTAPLPTALGEELAAHLARVFVDDVEDPFRGFTDLARGARVVAGEVAVPPDAWRTSELEALTPGATLAFTIEPNDLAPDAPRATWDVLTAELSLRTDDGERLELALVLAGDVLPRPDPEAGDLEEERDVPPTRMPVPRRERVVLDVAPAPDGAPLTLVLPTDAGTVLVTLQAAWIAYDGRDEVLAAALERHRSELARARADARRRSTVLGPDGGFRFESASALEALARPRLRRPALAFLAQATGAELVGELALAADDATLGALVEALERDAVAAEAVAEPETGGSAARFGWLLERGTVAWFAARAADPQAPPLAPELAGLLARRAGEVARYPDLLSDVARTSADTAAFDERLAGENRIFLEDGHPAPRVRAYDWLVLRGLAPEGYDPLASRDERRAALKAAEEVEGDQAAGAAEEAR